MNNKSENEENELTTVSLLGVNIDQKLKWKENITQLLKRLNTALFGISRISKLCDRTTSLSVYHALFHSKMTYGIVLWGGSPDLKKILKAQKKAVRYITGSPKTASCRDLFKKLNILTAPSAYIFEVLKYVKVNYEVFFNKIKKHDHFTRNKNSLVPTQSKLKTSQKGINFMGPKLYNKLPKNIKDSNEKTFNKKLKRLLIEKSFYSVKEFLKCTFA